MRVTRGAVLFAVGCLLATGCSDGEGREASAVVPRSTSTPSTSVLPTAAAAYLSAELLGTWRAGSTRITLADCAVGEECGDLRLRCSQHHTVRCRYPLVFRSATANGVNFATGHGNSFHCAWSPLSEGVVVLRPAPHGDMIEVVTGFPVFEDSPTITLSRAEQGSPH